MFNNNGYIFYKKTCFIIMKIKPSAAAHRHNGGAWRDTTKRQTRACVNKGHDI